MKLLVAYTGSAEYRQFGHANAMIPADFTRVQFEMKFAELTVNLFVKPGKLVGYDIAASISTKQVTPSAIRFIISSSINLICRI